MKQDIQEIIEIPANVNIEIDKNIVRASGEKGELEKKFVKVKKVKIEKQEKNIVIKAKNATKREKKMIGTIRAHIANMILGVSKGFVYKLKICSIHFPMSVSVAENEFIIKNFLGEIKERKAKILPCVEVKIEEDIVTVTSADIESAGQTASNIEAATKKKGKGLDKRVIQDGIYITSKAGKEI